MSSRVCAPSPENDSVAGVPQLVECTDSDVAASRHECDRRYGKSLHMNALCGR